MGKSNGVIQAEKSAQGVQTVQTSQTGNIPGESVTTNGGTEIPLSALLYVTDSADAPAVYYCSAINPAALDQACIDLVYAAPDSRPFVQRIESGNGIHTLEKAAAIGLGSRNYL